MPPFLNPAKVRENFLNRILAVPSTRLVPQIYQLVTLMVTSLFFSGTAVLLFASDNSGFFLSRTVKRLNYSCDKVFYILFCRLDRLEGT